MRIATSTRGYDITVHVYCARPEQSVSEAGDAAMDEYLRVFLKMKERIEAVFGKAAA